MMFKMSLSIFRKGDFYMYFIKLAFGSSRKTMLLNGSHISNTVTKTIKRLQPRSFTRQEVK